MQGRVHVRAGSEGFESDLGAWTYLGTKALGQKPYTPDFDADMVPTAVCRVLRIRADAFHSALRMAKADQILGTLAMKALAAQQRQRPAEQLANEQLGTSSAAASQPPVDQDHNFGSHSTTVAASGNNAGSVMVDLSSFDSAHSSRAVDDASYRRPPV